MELKREFLEQLQIRLKIGTRRGVHLNAIPGKSRYKFDLTKLSHIEKNLPNKFIEKLLSEQKLKFRIKWKDDNSDPNSVYGEKKPQIFKVLKTLENLINQTDAIESEKGINTLGFGFPILIKRDISDSKKITVSPVLIWSLRIKRAKEFNTLEVIRIEEDPIYLNEVLINHIKSDTNIDIKPIPPEMLDDGLISKDELIQICVNLINELNNEHSENIESDYIKSIDKIVTLGDKIHYEKMIPTNSNNALIEFSGLFSIFEVQKQNIIKDYDNLFRLKGVNVKQTELKNNKFQSISSVETDPSQQSILHSLETQKNILIQGPPGTGKSQTLLAILINALENHKKTIVVCEKRTALEVLHDGLIDKNLNQNFILIRDVIKDRRSVVDSVRERVDNYTNRKSQNNYSKNTLDIIVNKAKILIESINQKHKKLDEKLLGNKSWTDIVGALLNEMRGSNEDHILKINNYKFKYTPEELNILLQLVQEGQIYYSNFKPFINLSFLSPKKLIGDNPYILEQEINDSFISYESIIEIIHNLKENYKIEYFNIRKNQLSDQVEKGKEIQEIILEIHNRNKSNADFLDELKTNGVWYRVMSFFSKSKRKVVNDQNTISNYFKNLQKHYLKSPDLKSFKFSGSIESNLLWITEVNKIIEKESFGFKSKIDLEFENIDFINITKSELKTSTLKSILELSISLRLKINSDEWISENILNLEFNKFLSAIENIILAKKNYFANENDIFTKEFKWFNYFNSLPNETKILINELKDKMDWRKTFLIHYLNSLLVKYSIEDLSRMDLDHKDLNDTLHGLEKVQLNYINESWNSKQIEISRNFEKNNNLSVGNLYLKKQGSRNIRLSLREIVNRDIDLFTTFFPVILTSPDVASNLFQGKNEYFDIVMFDEASQLRLEDNLPSILKGKQVIIAGDEHQMPPSNYFSKVFDGTFADEDEIDQEEDIFYKKEDILLSCESLLDFANEFTYEKRHLDFHYRSKHPFLIDFSNYAFYNQRLKPLPNIFEYTPIKYIQVNGTFSDHINDEEAEMVLSIIENNINRLPNGKYPTVGIATFNITQRNHIVSKIFDRQKNSNLEEFNQKVRELLDNGLFIKNLENIQGDERDVIILSTTYGPGKDGKFARRFGPINHSKGYKLLNVIITRAKYKVYVCSSVPETEFMSYKNSLENEGSNNKSAILYAYLAYCKAVSDHDNIFRKEILSSLNKNLFNNNLLKSDSITEAESPFEEEVYKSLVQELGEANLTLRRRVSEFLIDIEYDPKIPNFPKIAIECDASKYHSSREAYLYDRHRKKILENHGYIFHRIWSTNWWRSPNQEAKQLTQFIKNLESKNDLFFSNNSSIALAFSDQIQKPNKYVIKKSSNISDHSFFEQEIIRIKNNYGSNYFLKSGLHAILLDLSPKIERKYFEVLKLADKMKLYESVSEIVTLNDNIKTITIQNLKEKFISNSGLDFRVASAVFWAYLYGNNIQSEKLSIESK